MLLFGKNLEAAKRTNKRLDEESYRNLFVAHLKTLSRKFSVTGETSYSNGRTDILIMKENQEPLLIAECKLWQGQQSVIEAIDQLLERYVNWGDDQVVVMLFNRDVKKFSEVINKAVKMVESHSLFLQRAEQRAETSYSYTFKNPADDKKKIRLELMLFNFA
jgi:hypothetical protein